MMRTCCVRREVHDTDCVLGNYCGLARFLTSIFVISEWCLSVLLIAFVIELCVNPIVLFVVVLVRVYCSLAVSSLLLCLFVLIVCIRFSFIFRGVTLRGITLRGITLRGITLRGVFVVFDVCVEHSEKN
jgi:hypothetical protein